MKARAWTGKKYVYDFFIDAKTGKPFYYQHYEGNMKATSIRKSGLLNNTPASKTKTARRIFFSMTF